jgi:hypothetical protein
MRLALPMALIALLVAAGPASARIVPFKSIAGVELGTSEADVRKQLGDPPVVRDGPIVGTRTFVYKRRKLEVRLLDGRVGSIATRSRGERTRDGIGVGVTLAELRRELRGERCTKVRLHTACEVSRRRAGMDYVVRRGRVYSVVLWSSSSAAQPPE